jgi:hypothetical protein
MKGQKEAVLEVVQRMLPNFNLYKDIALVMLTRDQLESLKYEIGQGIIAGQIEYSKPLLNHEAITYARSMVMNHLKKAKELNGNQIYGVGPAVVQSKSSKVLLSVNLDILPDDLKTYVGTLV